ncbi:hypothetical protein [Mycobacteroides abscessus]|uniref:hypothetical protein n=1 Tax=Mycobacteroides abscessus TaxID=36809 RepID=UPI0009C78AFE|nr:hypothetical protein [Mycobacteroides abscessus]SLJ13418.1 Uncharacterised protein [Mycobacteroides abscessus subsp. abscessus]
MNNTQSRPGAKVLASLVIVLGMSIGVVGCSGEHPAPSGPSTSGETSSSVTAQNMVDVSAVWATKPLPPCDDYLGTDQTAPPNLSVPDHASVAKTLAGVKSPGSIEWVRTKLGWLDKALSETRAGIVDTNVPGDETELHGFERYARHVRDELEVGHDISDSDADGDYPEGCR